MDVIPSMTFCQPSWRRVTMPCCRATAPMSVADARLTASRSMSFVCSMAPVQQLSGALRGRFGKTFDVANLFAPAGRPAQAAAARAVHT